MTALTLRAFQTDDVDILWREQIADRGPHWIVRPATHEERQRLETGAGLSGAWHEGVLSFGIDVDGLLVGDVQARDGGVNGVPGVYELGVELFPEHRRKGYGVVAIGAITSRLFEADGAHRVQITTDVDNVGMRRVAERLGFMLEGVMRGFMPAPPALPEGSPRDYAMYGMTNADFDQARKTWI